MPGLLSGYQAGQEAGRQRNIQAQALEEQRQQTEELKAKNMWDKEYQMFKSATDWANKLPVGRRGQYLNNYLTKQTGGSPEFKSIVDAMSSDDEETRKQMVSITKEINDSMQKGTDPELPISKLESIVGPDDPSVKFFKSKFTKYKDELFNSDVSEAVAMMESGGEVDDEEAVRFGQLQKKDPKIIIEASKLAKAKKEAMGGGDVEATKSADEIAGAIFGKSYADLTSPERTQVLKRKQEMAVEVSEAREGIKIRKASQEEIANLDNTKLIVDTLDKLSGSIITAKGAGEAITQRASLGAGALSKTNETAATYKDQREQFTGVLSRSLGGEKGVLTDRDIARITKGLPQFGDTKKIRDFKMGTIRLLIDTAVESKKRLMTNEPQSPTINRRLNELFEKLEGTETEANKLEKFMR